MATKIQTLKNNAGDIIYPQSKAVAVFTEDNKTVEAALKEKITQPTGNTGQLLGFTADNVIGAVDSPISGGSYFNKAFRGTLTTTWQGASAPYYQQFNIADMKATLCPVVFPQWNGFPPSLAESSAWNAISNSVESFDGYVKFYSMTKTTTPVNFILYYGNFQNPTGGEPVVLIDNSSPNPTRRTGEFFESQPN